MIRVMLFSNYLDFPEKVRSILMEGEFPKNRIVENADYGGKVVEALDGMTTSGVPSDLIEYAKWKSAHYKDGTIIRRAISNDNSADTIMYSDVFSFWHIRIVSVDNTRPWKISSRDEYDDNDALVSSYEYVKYLDYEIVDSKFNYAVEVGQSWL